MDCILYEVSQHLPIQTIIALTRTNSQLATIMYSNYIWYALYIRDYHTPPIHYNSQSIKHIYQSVYQLMKFENVVNYVSIWPKLMDVHFIDLTSRGLTQIPSGIFQAINLQQLILTDNHLTQLPVELFQLTNLQRLSIGCNSITQVPNNITQLVNLKRLYWRNNKLTNIPSDIASLTNLQVLYLGINKLTDIPSSFSKLINLQQLDLGYNSIKTLPTCMTQLTNLQKLTLEDYAWDQVLIGLHQSEIFV